MVGIRGPLEETPNAEIEKHYDRAVQTEYPGGVTGHSYVSVKTFWGNLK